MRIQPYLKVSISFFAVIGQELRTVDCDWMNEVNRIAHHTNEYNTNILVLRRGETFQLNMKLKRKINKEHDKIKLVLTQGMYVRWD